MKLNNAWAIIADKIEFIFSYNPSINFSQKQKLTEVTLSKRGGNYDRAKEQQKSTDQKHMFPSLPENINYIENKLCHSDDIKLDLPFQNGKGTILYIESLADLNLIHQLALEPLLTRSDLSLDKAFATLSMKKETNLNYGVQLLLQGKSLYFHEQVDSFVFSKQLYL